MWFFPLGGSRGFHPDLFGDRFVAYLQADDARLSRPVLFWDLAFHAVVDDPGVWRFPGIWNDEVNGEGLRYVVAKQEQYADVIDWDVMWYVFHDRFGPARVERIGDSWRDQLEPAVWGKTVAWVESSRFGRSGNVMVADEDSFHAPIGLGPGRHPGCTWTVDALPAPAMYGNMMDAWLNEDEAAAYDIDEYGNIALSRWFGPGFADFDFVYIRPDLSALDDGC